MAYNTRRRDIVKGTGGVLALGALAGCNGNSGNNSDGTTLSWADPWPEGHYHHTNTRDMFTSRVQELADTEVTWNIQSAGEIGGSGEMLSIARNNVADIVQVSPSYFSGQFPLSMSSSLPGAYESTEGGNETLWELSQGIIQEEELSSLGLKAVGVNATPPYKVTMTTDNKVETLEDFDGLSLRSAGGIMGTTISSLGASPNVIPPEDIVSAVQRDVIDGMLFPEPAITSYGITSNVQYHAYGVSTGGFASYSAISTDRFEELPTDVQEALVTAGEEVALEAGASLDELAADVRQELSDVGAEVYEIPDSEYERWVEAMRPAAQEWKGNADDESVATEVLDAWGLQA